MVENANSSKSKMKRMFQKINKKSVSDARDRSADSNTSTTPDPFENTPEENVRRAIKEFCNCGGPGNPNQADEVTFLPTIVESAEGSPTAAKEALLCLRKQLDSKNASKAFRQYNALMLLRILVDNPGAVFTRNIDAKFVAALKDLYKNGRDQGVRQLLNETLEYFENGKPEDTGLQPIREWYAKEKKKGDYGSGIAPLLEMHQARQNSYGPGPGAGSRQNSGLPPTAELAARISEAQMSAKLLLQILQSTPQDEIIGNPLIREFADRCASASRSVQTFIEAQNPPPDESTLVTLFETNEQLASALSKHQLAIYAAKKANKPEMHGAAQTIPSPQAQLPAANYVRPQRQQPEPLLPLPPQMPPPAEPGYPQSPQAGPSTELYADVLYARTGPSNSSAYGSEEVHYYNPPNHPYGQTHVNDPNEPHFAGYDQPHSSRQEKPFRDSTEYAQAPKPPPPRVSVNHYVEDSAPSNGYLVSSQSVSVEGQIPHGFTPYQY